MLSAAPSEAGEIVETAELEQAMASADEYLTGIVKAQLGDEIDVLEKVLVDAYTPGDIKASISTTYKGRLVEGLG